MCPKDGKIGRRMSYSEHGGWTYEWNGKFYKE